MATVKQDSILYTESSSRRRNSKCRFVFGVFVFCLLSLESDALNNCTDLFPACTCSRTDVTCVDEKHLRSITELYPYIGDDVEHITINGSNFREFPTNFLGSCKNAKDLRLENLKSLVLPNNHIQTIHGKSFHCLPNLETLNLNYNEWKIDRYIKQTGYFTYFTSLPKLKDLYLIDAFDNGTIHYVKLEEIFKETDMTQLQTLDLSKNEHLSFSEDAADTFCRLTSLRYLNLSYNKLDVPSFSTKKDCLTNLEILDFSNNRIENLPDSFMHKLDSMKNLKMVYLGNNRYRCDGDFRRTWKWLNTTRVQIKDRQHIRCGSKSYYPRLSGKLVLSLEPSDLEYHVPEQTRHGTSNVGIGLAFAIIGCVVIGFLIYILKRKQLGNCWKKCSPKTTL